MIGNSYGFDVGASTAGAGTSNTCGGTCLAAVTALPIAAVCADISARMARNSSAKRYGMASILVFRLA